MEDELAGVTVPPSRKAGLRVGILAMLALGGCSSLSTTRSVLPDLTVTGVTSDLNQPSEMAFWARVSEMMAQRSCSSRVKP